MALEIATSSAAILPDLLTGMNGLGSAIMYLVPLAIITYSFYTVIDFNQTNNVLFSSIEDTLDKDIFQKMVIPLYDAITSNLFDDTYISISNESTRDKKKFLEKYEEAKKEKLKRVDFTFLNAALDFQTAITKIIESRKNHSDFSKLKKITRRRLIYTGISSIVSVIFIIASNITSFFSFLGVLSNILLAIYGIFLLLSFIILGLYVKNKITLDNFA